MPAAGEPEAVQLLVLDAMAGEAPAASDAVALPPKVDKVDAGLASRTATRTGSSWVASSGAAWTDSSPDTRDDAHTLRPVDCAEQSGTRLCKSNVSALLS